MVRVIRFSEAVNASEVAAATKSKTALETLGDSAPWILFAGLASSSSPLHQSDDLDLVPIGPRGVFVIEVKHWDAAWISNNKASAEFEAEKLTAKAKRFSGRVRRALVDSPKVIQAFLLTREPAGPNLPQSIRGVPVWTLRDLARTFRDFPKAVLTESQVKLLAATLEPTAKVGMDGKIRRIASYQNLELQTPNQNTFHRIYKGLHQRTKERVILHLYDLSASEEKNPDFYDGDLPGAQRNVAQALIGATKTGDIGGQIFYLSTTAGGLVVQGMNDQATQYADRAIAIAAKTQLPLGTVLPLCIAQGLCQGRYLRPIATHGGRVAFPVEIALNNETEHPKFLVRLQ